MSISQPLSPQTSDDAQHVLFAQILRTVRMTVIGLFVLHLGLLLIPAMRTWPIILLTIITALEIGNIELSNWLMQHGRSRQGAVFFLVATLILAIMVGIVLQLPAFIAAVTALMVVMSALLVGPRYALLPGAIGIAFYILLTIANRQDWLIGIQFQETSWLVTLVQVVFVCAALIVMIVVSMLGSDQLQRSLRDVQTRAEEAERAQTAQTELTGRLATQIDEQRRLLEVIQSLETPAIPVLPGVLVLPLVSHFDSRRLQAVERRLLDQVAADRSTLVLIDITGVPTVDTAVAGGIIRMAQALRLLGTQTALTGLGPAIAQTLVELDINLGTIRTYATIQDALAETT